MNLSFALRRCGEAFGQIGQHALPTKMICRQFSTACALFEKENCEAGSQFVVMGEDDVVIMKTIDKPSIQDFDSLIKKARRQARSAGLKRSDIAEAVTAVRSGE